MKKRVQLFLILCFLSVPILAQDDCEDIYEVIVKLYDKKDWKGIKRESKSYLQHCGSNAQVEQWLKESEDKLKPQLPKPAPIIQKSEDTKKLRFSVNKTYVEFLDSGGQEQIFITADNAWDIYDYPGWVDIERQNNTLFITCDPNFYSSAREDDIVLIDENDKELHVTISQDKSKYYLRLSSNNLNETKGDGRTYIIDISTNTSWYIKDKPRWCDVETIGNQIKIKLERNKTGYDRDGVIEICSSQPNIRSLFFIKQGALRNYIILMSKTINDVNGKGGTLKISVDTDHDYYYFENLPYWCTITEKTSSSFSIVLNDNSGGNAREAQCKVVAGDQSETLTIKQGARLSYINVSSSKITAMNAGGIITITVNSSGAWRVVNVPDWCQVVEETNNSFVLRIMPNNGYARSATFAVSSSGIRENIVVEQQ